MGGYGYGGISNRGFIGFERRNIGIPAYDRMRALGVEEQARADADARDMAAQRALSRLGPEPSRAEVTGAMQGAMQGVPGGGPVLNQLLMEGVSRRERDAETEASREFQRETATTAHERSRAMEGVRHGLMEARRKASKSDAEERDREREFFAAAREGRMDTARAIAERYDLDVPDDFYDRFGRDAEYRRVVDMAESYQDTDPQYAAKLMAGYDKTGSYVGAIEVAGEPKGEGATRFKDLPAEAKRVEHLVATGAAPDYETAYEMVREPDKAAEWMTREWVRGQIADGNSPTEAEIAAVHTRFSKYLQGEGSPVDVPEEISGFGAAKGGGATGDPDDIRGLLP